MCSECNNYVFNDYFKQHFQSLKLKPHNIKK